MVDTTYILEYLFCCQFTTNNNIIDLLEDLATKKQKCLLSNKIKLYGDDYRKLYLDVLKYFKLKDTENCGDHKIIKNWSSIRKKALKDLILKNYIIEVKYKYKFEDSTTKNLKRELMIGLNSKIVNDKNIVIKNNKILTIVGLNLDINTYSWNYDIFSYK
jgi:hypothetical protein